jgi:glycosyltransferase involved in cell wall biosynthesis
VKVLIALSGLHRVHRGAEVALEAVGRGLAERGHEVTLLGSGAAREGDPYRFVHSPAVSRERFEHFPNGPTLRNEFAYEELTFALGALARFRPGAHDVTLTCGYPYTNWLLRRPARHAAAHVFVTQNGDWPATSDDKEFRFFRCDGLVCTNPEYYERNRSRWPATLIPNGIDVDRFFPGDGDRAALGLPAGVPIVLMVSALMPSKRVDVAVRAVAALEGVHLVVAGDGADRGAIERLAETHMPGRFHRVTLPFATMPVLYRSVDVFLHTTLKESFGNVYVEAMATGLPVVAHDSVITRWILGESDLLVDTDDTAALDAALRRALAVGACAEERPPPDVTRFSWPRVVDAYEAFLTEVVARRS